MGSPHIGYKELLNIETSILAVTIKGSDNIPLLQSEEGKKKESVIRVACDDSYDIMLSGEHADPGIEIIHHSFSGEYYTAPIFFEQRQYELIIEADEGHTVSFWHENYNIRNKITQVGKNRTLLTGVINFGNDIGKSDLVILVDGHSYLIVTIEVFPSKISYKDDYKAIITDVTSEIYNLIFDFLKKTYDTFDVSTTQQASMVEFFAIIRRIYSEMMKSTDRVIQNPHHLLQTEHEVLPYHKVRRIDNRSLRWVESHPQHIVRNAGEIKVDKVLAAKKYITYDTKENRLTKYMLESTAKRLIRFRNLYCRLDRKEDEIILEQIDSMISGINRRCNTGFMKEVNSVPAKTGMSLVFSMAPGYREIFKYYLMLQHGLSVTGGVFDLSVKDLAVLYEYWCFIKLNSFMKSRYELVSQDVIRIDGSGLYVSLVKGKSSTVKYKNPGTGELITLSYNPKEIASPTVSQRPDNVLSLYKNGSRNNYEYVFDAKYRINPAYPETDYYRNISHSPGPEIDDINTMHRYRDAIVYSKGSSPSERTMFGAYVLFPYSNEKEYRNHRFYKSIDKVNVGGLPFLPSTTELVKDFLDELIIESSESAFERAVLPAGIEGKLAKVNWKKRDVLIGTIDNQDQLESILNRKCYYIPKKRVKAQNLPIHYVAIYQTKAKFGAKAGIEYYGEVISTHAIKHSELPESLWKPEEEYYCFEVSEWKRLPNPIKPKDIGFSIDYTNIFLLQHSYYVPELLLQSEDEYRLFSELRRRTDPAIINVDANSAMFEIAGARIAFEDGNIEVYRNKNLVNVSPIKAFSRTPGIVFRDIMKCISQPEAK